MLAVLIIWVVLLTIFLALGDLVFLMFSDKKDNNNLQSISATFFVGIAIACIIACGISVFAPLTSNIFLVLASICIVYWIIYRKRLQSISSTAISIFRNTPLWGKAILVFFCFIILYHSASFSSSFDQFLYHQQHIKWLQEYGVVNGLANLHLRFGFNSSSLSMVSLFAYHPDLKISFTALNGLTLLIFALWLIIRMTRSKHVVLGFIYAGTLVVFCHFYAMELSSTSTDVMVNIIVAYLLLNCLSERKVECFYLPLAILPVLCVTLKLSSAPIIIISLYSYYTLIISKRTKQLIGVLILSALISIFWLIQNVILSGYLVFPFSSLDLFSFDWKVPSSIVSKEQAMTYNWAKGTDMGDTNLFGWIPQWWMGLPIMDKIIYLLGIGSVIPSIILMKKILRKGLFTVGYITAITGTLFVFFTAPALRFSLGFTLLSAFFTMYLLHNISKKTAPDIMVKIAQYALIVAFAIFHVYYIGDKTIEKVNLGSEYLRAQYIKPFPIHYAALNIKFDSIEVNKTKIFTPSTGDSCYDHELPCAPAVNNNLELRGATLAKGFRIKQR